MRTYLVWLIDDVAGEVAQALGQRGNPLRIVAADMRIEADDKRRAYVFYDEGKRIIVAFTFGWVRATLVAE